MLKKILITGCDGYIGWPFFLKTALKNKNYKIIGVDNFGRRKWVKEVKEKSFTKVYSFNERLKELKKISKRKNFRFINLDLTNYKKTSSLIKKFKPDIIFHLAAQPSAPYANSNPQRATYTNYNNNQSTLNMLWALKKNNLLKTIFVETTTTGVYGTPDFNINEGFNILNKNPIPFHNLGGSWYHISKSNDCNYLWLANRLWGLTVIDFRTAITLGLNTSETKLSKKFLNRFDYDFYFGVVANKFIIRSIHNKKIEIYGKGKQKKPFIDLQDVVDSLFNVINFKGNKKFNVFNQFSETISITQITNWIKEIQKKYRKKGKVIHIINPRVENETHQMIMKNNKFKKILRRKPKSIKQSITDTYNTIV